MSKEMLPKLTNREKGVLKWIIEGKTDWEIAKILNISQRTVRFHTDNIIYKFGALNKLHAAVAAVRLGMDD